MEVNTGIKYEDRKEIAEGLSRLLADTYALYLKTQNFHWNVKGPSFHSLHVMFEEHYTEMATAIDEIAERILALGFPAPGSFSAFTRLSSIAEENEVPEATAMVRQLVEGHEALIKTAKTLLPKAEKANDDATLDLMVQRMQTHEKTAWMLRSSLGN